MAIDSAVKRASALSFNMFGKIIIPDGTIDQGDRQTILGVYSGILAGAFVIIGYHWNSPFTRVFD